MSSKVVMPEFRTPGEPAPWMKKALIGTGALVLASTLGLGGVMISRSRAADAAALEANLRQAALAAPKPVPPSAPKPAPAAAPALASPTENREAKGPVASAGQDEAKSETTSAKGHKNHHAKRGKHAGHHAMAKGGKAAPKVAAPAAKPAQKQMKDSDLDSLLKSFK